MELGHLYGNVDTISSSILHYKSIDNFERNSHKADIGNHRSPLVYSRYTEGFGTINSIQEGSGNYSAIFNQLLESTQKLVGEIKADSKLETKLSTMKASSASGFSQTYKSPLKMSLIGEYKTERLLDSYGRKGTFKFPSRDPKLLIEESYRLIADIKSPIKTVRTVIGKFEGQAIKKQKENINTEADATSPGAVNLQQYLPQNQNKLISGISVSDNKDSMRQGSSVDNQDRSGIFKYGPISPNSLIPELTLDKDGREYSSNLSLSVSQRRPDNTKASNKPQKASALSKTTKNIPKKTENLYKQNNNRVNTGSDLDDSPKPYTALSIDPQPRPQPEKITLTYVPTKPKKGILKDSRDSLSFQKSYDGMKSTKSIDTSFAQSAIGKGVSITASDFNFDSRNASKRRDQFSGKPSSAKNQHKPSFNWSNFK